jgi:terminase large subunit-like protein
MEAFELRYQCLTLAQNELEPRGPYSINQLLSLADIFSRFISGQTKIRTPEIESDKTVIEHARLGDLTASQFISDFCWLMAPTLGVVPFQLYDYQKEILQAIQDHPIVFVLTARQMGLSSLMAAYMLYESFKKPNQNILFIGLKNQVCRDHLHQINFMYDRLPEALRAQKINNSANSIEFSNGSRISAHPAVRSIHGLSLDLIVIDQFALVHDDVAKELWSSAKACMRTGGRVVVPTTPGRGQFFTQTWDDTKNIHKIELPYLRHPDRNIKWGEKHRPLMSDKDFMREYECQFV